MVATKGACLQLLAESVARPHTRNFAGVHGIHKPKSVFVWQQSRRHTWPRSEDHKRHQVTYCQSPPAGFEKRHGGVVV